MVAATINGGSHVTTAHIETASWRAAIRQNRADGRLVVEGIVMFEFLILWLKVASVLLIAFSLTIVLLIALGLIPIKKQK